MKIKYIDSKKMILEDDSEWQFLGANPPPVSWKAGDDVDIEKRGQKIKSDIVINRTKEDQERAIAYIKGGISKRYKTGEEEAYPDEWLDQDWKVKDLLEDGHIVIADPSPNGSIWLINNYSSKNEGNWAPGQRIRISKGNARFVSYQIENFDINRPPFVASFMGWAKSKF